MSSFSLKGELFSTLKLQTEWRSVRGLYERPTDFCVVIVFLDKRPTNLWVETNENNPVLVLKTRKHSVEYFRVAAKQ